jgi:uncharacterized protein
MKGNKMNKGLLLSALLGSAALITPSSAEARDINLCTGSTSGVYYSVGQMIGTYVGNDLKINVVETAGTFDNMDRMLSGQCDAMIGQPDGPVYLKRTKPSDAAKISAPIMKFHAEYLHVLCSKESGVEDLSELESNPEKYTVAIGAPGSGAWLIWQNIIEQDDDYAKIPTKAESGITALASVASNETTCMIVPSGIPNGVVAEADANWGDQIVLVSADDKDFNDAEDVDGKALYKFVDLPTNKYTTTFGRYWSNPETIGWTAALYVNKSTLTGKDLENLIRAASRARSAITSTYGKLD